LYLLHIRFYQILVTGPVENPDFIGVAPTLNPAFIL